MAQHVGWRMVGDLRLPNARRVVSEAFRTLTLKTAVVKMPPDISTPKMQPMQSIKTNVFHAHSNHLKPKSAIALWSSVRSRHVIS